MVAIKEHFRKEKIEELASKFAKQNAGFNHQDFVKMAILNLEKLEYRERVAQIADALFKRFLNFEAFAKTAMSVLKTWQNKKRDYRDDFICESIAYVVQEKGLEYPELSFDLMEGITQVFTAEWCVRPFVDKQWPALEKRFAVWQKSDNHHFRRLVSEGTRPNLPWGKKLEKLNNEPYFALAWILPMANDASDYVCKSVSNHLNDFWKKDPKKLVEICKDLKQQNSISDKYLRQTLRNLIKQGNTDALALVGVLPFKGKLIEFNHPKKIKLGQKVGFNVELQSDKKQDLEIDYVLNFLQKNGNYGKTIFKGHRKNVDNERFKGEFNFHLKPITTRKYFAGIQKLSLQVNGKILAESEFLLEVKKINIAITYQNKIVT